MSWKSMTFQGPPTLIVGLREGRRQVEGRRVSLETRVHKDLNEVVTRTLARLDAMTAITYTPYVGAGEGEYLTIKPRALVTQSVSKDGDGVLTQKEQTAALVELVQRADDLPDIGAGELIKQLKDGSLYLQAICRRTSAGRVGFVTKSAARQILKAGSIPLIKGKSDHFTKTEPPEIVLEPDVHVVVKPDELAVLSKSQFEFMVSDSPLVASYVPAYVKRIDQEFKKRKITLSRSTVAALEAKAQSSVRVARRLDAVVERIAVVDVARITSGVGFKAQDLKRRDFVNAKGEIECAPERIVELLDALEGRFFGDAFTDEQRRADSFRQRR